MKKEIKKDKTEIISLILSTVENDSHNKQAAREFLSSENLGVDNIVSDGLKRIKQMQMMIEAEKTKDEMNSADVYKKQAEEWVEKLLNEIDFSLPNVIEKEKLTVSFRNVESLSIDDVKKILIKHFTLKFMNKKE
ncbi:hypothetical protein [Ferruginibacter albus]|uniref:hypothetical protein n=1 Tax=Ferruginibacter albus TaxID=2875540 RepID=UPI001CC58820|nr:hypothetical protein [Ferruginibacter albus]UAY51292.1 hypothetical protein K9M53_11905 [Ferruginibacter albus]